MPREVALEKAKSREKKKRKEKKKKMTSFTIATKTIKYLGINLTQEVKDPNSENYETLMSLKEMQIKGKAPCAHREKSNGAENVGTSKGYWQTQGKIPIETKDGRSGLSGDGKDRVEGWVGHPKSKAQGRGWGKEGESPL